MHEAENPCSDKTHLTQKEIKSNHRFFKGASPGAFPRGTYPAAAFRDAYPASASRDIYHGASAREPSPRVTSKYISPNALCQGAYPEASSQGYKHGRGRRAALHILNKLQKASLVLETAMVLPLFLLAMITMISFMDIYSLETRHLTGLCETVKEAGIAAYVADGSGVDEIVLPDVYSCRMVGGILPQSKIYRFNIVRAHAWTGREYEKGGQEAEEDEEMVYVTETGRVYHRSLNCSYINLSVKSIPGSSIASKRNSSGGKYYACESCSAGQSPAGIVYVTSSGTRYHNDPDCSALKRTVSLVPLSQCSGKSPCSRCG